MGAIATNGWNNAEITDRQIDAEVNDIATMKGQDQKIEAMMLLLEKLNQRNQRQINKIAEGQEALTQAIASIEVRINDEEVDDPTKKVKQASNIKPGNVKGGQVEAQVMTEADVGRWMDESLEFEYLNMEATEWAKAVALDSMVNAPGVELRDMQCGDGFCRAQFSSLEADKPAEIGELFGYPPFMTEGFTLVKADGSVLLYFTEEGVSIDDLRFRVGERQQIN